MSIDVIQIVFWILTYILIAFFSITKKQIIIPIFAILPNISWEIISVLNDIVEGYFSIIFIFHLFWFLLDLTILISYILVYKKRKLIIIYILLITIFSLSLYYIFKLDNGMLLSSFILDLSMAVSYIFFFYKNNFKNNIIIYGIIFCKLLGDLFAWLFYRNFMNIINYIGIIVLILNVLCFFIYYYKNKTIYSNK